MLSSVYYFDFGKEFIHRNGKHFVSGYDLEDYESFLFFNVPPTKNNQNEKKKFFNVLIRWYET